jgi:methionyl-tRNA formyltransferase
VRLVFAGTPDFAATALNALLQTDHEVVGVYSQPDRPSGRGRKLAPSPVKQAALDAGIPVFQPQTLKTPEAREQLTDLNADIMVVAAYGLILPQAILDIPRHGCLNIHASLLPRWRGAAPIQRAIAAGDRQTGITIMQMDAGLDTGDMLLKLTTPITDSDTGGSLHDRLADLGGDAIIDALAGITEGTLRPTPQDNAQACYASKLSKEEGQIDWTEDATAIHRKIRAFNPWPGTYTDAGDLRVRLHESEVVDITSDRHPGTVVARSREGIDIACGLDVLRVTRLQLPGSRAQSVNDLINGGKDILMPGQELD